jgi:ribosomal protein S18 acetylase RimI-like enzyme
LHTIIQAKTSDTGEISEFLEHARSIHRHLDWTPLLDWINSPPFLLYREEGTIQGILSCPPDPDKIPWIKCYASQSADSVYQIFSTLITEAVRVLSKTSDYIYALGLQDWFIRILVQQGFENFQNVVVLAHNRQSPKKVQNSILNIRSMEHSDTHEVAELDSLAFEPVWTISEKGLVEAFYQAAHASVVEVDGKIVGYELSTASHFSAHLARVAVLPQFQHENIGLQLVAEMISYFQERDIFEITVNTQDTNKASLHLYKKLGFSQTGDQFPIYRISLKEFTGQ